MSSSVYVQLLKSTFRCSRDFVLPFAGCFTVSSEVKAVLMSAHSFMCLCFHLIVHHIVEILDNVL